MPTVRMRPARAIVCLYLVTATSAVLNHTFYRQWTDTRFKGTTILTVEIWKDSALQCGAACLSRGEACAAFVTRRTEGGVLCELLGDIQKRTAVSGTHLYCSQTAISRLIADLGYVDVGNGQYYKFVTGGGNSWQESVTECDESFGSLFVPESHEEFLSVQSYKDQQSLSGNLWIGLRYDVNYPVDIYNLEGHDRDAAKFCLTMKDGHDHMHYEDCGADFDGKICKLDPLLL